MAAALPELGAHGDVLRHRSGPADQWARRIFAQCADGTQLDLAVLATASQAAARRHPADLPAAMAAYVTHALSREP